MPKLDNDEIALHKFLINDYHLRKDLPFSKVYHRHWNKEIVDFVPDRSFKVILDCGCGNGVLLEFLIEDKRFSRVYGIDLSFEMLKEIQAKGKVVNSDFECLPIKDCSVEIVLCRGALHHALNVEKVVKEINRILIPQGIFVISEPCADSWILRLPRRYFKKYSKKISLRHKSFFVKELINMISAHNFSLKKMKKFGFLAFPLCGLPDFCAIMRYMPFSKLITKYLIAFDIICAHIPLLHHESWGVSMAFEKIKNLY